MNERDQAAEGAAILHRLVPTSEPGQRRDPETGVVYYSSEWLSDRPALSLVPDLSTDKPSRGASPRRDNAPAPTKGD